MHIPWFSTVTLITELFVTWGVLYVFYSSMKKNVFPYKVVVVTLGYEILFNISYMLTRVLSHENPSKLESPVAIGLAIFHGIFSLVMFVALLVFMFIAWRKYRQGVNFFSNHKNLTFSFIVCWLLAVVSGIIFYFVTYF